MSARSVIAPPLTITFAWISSDENVAVIDQQGRIVPKGEGVATISFSTTYWLFGRVVESFIEKITVKVFKKLNEDLAIVDNIANCSTSIIPENRKSIAKAITKIMIQQEYPVAFIAGIIANIVHEGEVGQFESSNYSDPLRKPDYLTYMDSNYKGENYYLDNYSKKIITEVDVVEVYNMLNDLKTNSQDTWEINGSRVGFGLGCIQWSFDRTYTLVKVYLEKNYNSSTITETQLLDAESTMIIRELNSARYEKIFTDWESNCIDENSKEAAKLAAIELCSRYLVPFDMENQKANRGNLAEQIYEVMIS